MLKKIVAERMKVGGKLSTSTSDALNMVAVIVSASSVPLAMEQVRI